MTKFLMVLTSAILALLLIVFGLLLVRNKPIPTSSAKYPADDAAIAPPELWVSEPAPSNGETSGSDGQVVAIPSGDEAQQLGDVLEQQPGVSMVGLSSSENPADVDQDALRGIAPVANEASATTDAMASQAIQITPEARGQGTAVEGDVFAAPAIAGSDPSEADRIGDVHVNGTEAVAPDQVEGDGDQSPLSSAQPPRTYRVHGGDTLVSISRSLYGDVSLWTVIADENPSVNPSMLRVGQILQLPPASALAVKQAPQEAVRAGPVLHRVRSGDSLYSIAKMYYGDSALWKRIRDANPKGLEKGVRQLPVGGKLTIPQLISP